MIVSECKDLILKGEGISVDQWKEYPGNLWRPDARMASITLLKANELFAGEKLQTGLKSLILEFEKSPGYESLAKSSPLIFDYREAGSEEYPWAFRIFIENTLSWALTYLDGLEVNLKMVKASVSVIN